MRWEDYTLQGLPPSRAERLIDELRGELEEMTLRDARGEVSLDNMYGQVLEHVQMGVRYHRAKLIEEARRVLDV